MSNSKFIIYSVYHKPFIKPTAGFVVPIHAGKAISKTDLAIAGDDTGNNISALNPNFCELTVLYWIWKNVAFNTDDIWGLAHYRRYFIMPPLRLFKKKKSTFQKSATAKVLNETINGKLLQYMQKKLQTADVIVQQPDYVRNKNGQIQTLEVNYFEDHIAQHWQITKQVVLQFYPDYAAAFEAVSNSVQLSYANMMVANAALWNGYLSWLFTIIFEVQKLIEVPADAYQARVFGFLAERLMAVYLKHNKVREAYMPLGFFE